jgi:small subunit ribosomal protein S17
MAKKKKDEETEVVETPTETTEAVAEETVEAAATATTEEPTIVESVIETVAAAVTSVADAVVETVSNLVGGSNKEVNKSATSNRAQRIGVVTSDKMTKTVVVRVDRLIKHPKYRRYVRRKKQFMAHDELGATIGDKVRIVETRPLSARKRWRVAEIVQKAAK